MILEFLRFELINNQFIYLQLWSIVHFFAGFFLWKLFKLKPVVVILIIIGFEILEPHFPMFKGETNIDTLWDVLVGLLGYYAAKKELKLR